jgi:hypothetical protein
MVDIYIPVVECGYVPFFADVLSIYTVDLIISLSSVKELISVMVKCGVLFELRTKFLNII